MVRDRRQPRPVISVNGVLPEIAHLETGKGRIVDLVAAEEPRVAVRVLPREHRRTCAWHVRSRSYAHGAIDPCCIESARAGHPGPLTAAGRELPQVIQILPSTLWRPP